MGNLFYLYTAYEKRFLFLESLAWLPESKRRMLELLCISDRRTARERQFRNNPDGKFRTASAQEKGREVQNPVGDPALYMLQFRFSDRGSGCLASGSMEDDAL